jgi:hypothetical protein
MKSQLQCFFKHFFQRFLGIIQVAHLVMCYILKCSSGSVVFLQINNTLNKSVQLTAISIWKWPSFYSSFLVLDWRSAWPNCLKSNSFLSRILFFTFCRFQNSIICPVSINFSLCNLILKSANSQQKHVFLRFFVIFGVF